MSKQGEIAILYSGGSDSSCAAAIMANEFNVIHLLTFDRLGFSQIENSNFNLETFRNKFPQTVFIHKIINVDRLAKFISCENSFKDLFKYGFFVLSNCIICGLINHFRMLLYCLDNNINNVADGSTREWPFFPTHMEKVILEFKNMYANFNIQYHTPVYDFETPPFIRLIDKVYPVRGIEGESGSGNIYKKTTGNYLFQSGIFPSADVKGTQLDHHIQPHCLQFILHHVYLYWYFMAWHNYEDFEAVTLRFIRDKLNRLMKLVENNPDKIKELIKEEIGRREI